MKKLALLLASLAFGLAPLAWADCGPDHDAAQSASAPAAQDMSKAPAKTVTATAHKQASKEAKAGAKHKQGTEKVASNTPR
jgi:hypothetical protein